MSTSQASISILPTSLLPQSSFGLEIVELNNENDGPCTTPASFMLEPSQLSLLEVDGGNNSISSASSAASASSASLPTVAGTSCNQMLRVIIHHNESLGNSHHGDFDNNNNNNNNNGGKNYMKQFTLSKDDHRSNNHVPMQVETGHEALRVRDKDQDENAMDAENAFTPDYSVENNDDSDPEVEVIENNIPLGTIPRILIIHDAFLSEVPDDDDVDVIIATHLERTRSWWKQKHIQLILTALFLFAVSNAIAIGVLYHSQDGKNKTSIAATAPSPSSTTWSSSSTSHQPSVPLNSLTPNACADQIMANAQKIMIGLENPRHPSVAVDGNNMVMAVGDGDTTTSQVVIFYSLNGIWHEVSSFRMDNVGSSKASVSLSGQTAFVGFGDANKFDGTVLVFQQSELGIWEQVNDPFIRTTTANETRYGFGLHHVHIDGDLACIVDYNDCVVGVVIASCNHNVNVFRRIGERWEERDVIPGEYCRIAGDVLVVLSFASFSYDTRNLHFYQLNNTDVDAFVPYQDLIIVYDDVLSMELTKNYFVYWDRFLEGAVIYHRQNDSGPYFFVEQIFITARLENQIALHNNILVVGGDTEAHIFSEDNGNWAEVITLDQRYGNYEFYQVSGRTLLATSEMNVYSFNIEECSQEMSTQSSPSSPIVPSSSPAPSLEPLSSSSSPITPTLSLGSSSTSSILASSFSPTTCDNIVLSNSQRIETFLESPRYLTMDIDGMTMVMVVEDGNGSDYVMFYKFANDGGWEIDEDFDLGDLSKDLEVVAAISGNAAFVGFQGAFDNVGTVIVFHRNQAGEWEKVSDPFDLYSPAPSKAFGNGVAIEGNLAIVATDNDADNKIMAFLRQSEKWVQFDMFNGWCPCSIAGDVIVSVKTDDVLKVFVQLYKYTVDKGTLTPFQDSFPVGKVKQVDSSRDYFIYWDLAASWVDDPTSGEKTSNTFMYHRADGNQTFAFVQQFNISGDNDALSIDNDILVVSGHIFSLQNGDWVESFILDRLFDEYKLSGRRLLARSEEGIVSFSIDKCTQEIPTQIPSLSVSPSDAPSKSAPTTQPSSSIAPSLSLSPTANPSKSLAPTFTSSPTDTCYWIVISINFDGFSSEVFWQLFRKDDSNGSEELLRSYGTTKEIPLYLDSFCLQEGTYEFIIFDLAHDGLCCKYDETAFYSLSLDSGVLIRKGGEFGYSESTVFSIPYFPSL